MTICAEGVYVSEIKIRKLTPSNTDLNMQLVMTLAFKLTERSKCTFLLEQNLPLVIYGTKNGKKVIISFIHLFHVSNELALESISQLMPGTLLANTVAIFMPVILDRVLFKD